ncbi:hypothetical protein BHE74_00019874 [Ensete ventricosum]|nr:hypothetical protein GW17_00011193 [Ensete ventricosum]RWW72313.1 hypothetical protein BHE74_00019874 [Ensete ventricosum]RZR98924.1 hypothetical protein BHM03_00028379 [Ensete ventricosum]
MLLRVKYPSHDSIVMPSHPCQTPTSTRKEPQGSQASTALRLRLILGNFFQAFASLCSTSFAHKTDIASCPRQSTLTMTNATRHNIIHHHWSSFMAGLPLESDQKAEGCT